MDNKRLSVPSKNRLRSLKQYRDLSEEEFDDIWSKKITGIDTIKEFENRIEAKLKKFEDDYDLKDLKVNDMLSLRALAQAYISLEDLENYSYNFRTGGIESERILEMEKVNNVMSGLRRDISTMQNDLKISRKTRSEKDETVLSYLENLKQQAKKFYKSRMFYVFCDKCSMLLFTGWFLYPNENNIITLTCNRKLQDGSKCGNKIKITSAELLSKRGVNLDTVPEYFK
jgi:hypothetical protein